MKNTVLLIAALICGCSSFKHPDINESKKVVEALIQKENSGDYSNMSQYYTDDFNQTESEQMRVDRFRSLHEALGDFVSDECVKSNDSTDLNDFPSVFLQYKVKHSKLTSVENFMVIREEGNLKVEQHNIVQE